MYFKAFISKCGFVKCYKWSEEKWNDIQPSMVTHTQNSCSAFTHPNAHTHTMNTHTHTVHTPGTVGRHFMLQCPGSSWGIGALFKGTSVVVLKVERALNIHYPHLQSLPDQDSNSQPFDYESNSLTLGHDFLLYSDIITHKRNNA